MMVWILGGMLPRLLGQILDGFVIVVYDGRDNDYGFIIVGMMVELPCMIVSKTLI